MTVESRPRWRCLLPWILSAPLLILFFLVPGWEPLPLRIFHLCLLLLLLLVSLYFSRADRRRHLEQLLEIRREMEKHELRYRALLEEAGEAIFILDAESGKMKEMNRRGSELLGYSPRELAEVTGRDLVLQDDLDKYLSLVRSVLRGEPLVTGRISFRRRDGSVFLGEVSITRIGLGDEKVVQAIMRDVTFTVQAEEEIRRTNRELSILNAIVVRANEELRLERALELVLDETVLELEARGGSIHLMDEEGKPVASLERNIREPGGGAPHPEAHLCAAMRERQVKVHMAHDACPLARTVPDNPCFVGIPLLAKGRLLGIMHLLFDSAAACDDTHQAFFHTLGNQVGMAMEHIILFRQMDERNEELLRSCRLLQASTRSLALSEKRLRENLELVERANQEMERVDRMKNQFLGMISHEFRTPLTGIISGAEFLAAGARELSREQQAVLDIVKQGGERLNAIVADLLKLAALEGKNVAVVRRPVVLAELFHGILQELQPCLLERNQTIVIGDMEQIPCFNADADYLRDVVAELLQNSIKFTPDGGTISLSTRLTDREALEPKRETLQRFHHGFLEQMEQKWYLELAISDTGIGIAGEDQLRIFEKFYEVGDIRHHSSGSHKFMGKGAGIGLAIAKGLVDAQGGMIWVESAPGGVGSSFFVLLPLEEGYRQGALPFSQ